LRIYDYLYYKLPLPITSKQDITQHGEEGEEYKKKNRKEGQQAWGEQHAYSWVNRSSSNCVETGRLRCVRRRTGCMRRITGRRSS
jgi:hypothetical protein